MKYKSVAATQKGGPEALRVVENDLREPSGKQVRIKVLASCVTLPDVQARYGQSPFPQKFPFVPGYVIIGTVDALGEKAAHAAIGARVAAHTVIGGYAEYIYVDEEQLIPLPICLDVAEAVVLILNYLVAYQSLHRSAKVKSGDKILIIGASGGIGTAFLQLGKLANLCMYGLASKSKHSILTEYGATPIDYHTQDFVDVIQKLEPDGLDAVFDGMGGDYFSRGASLLKRGGVLVEYGNTLTMSGLLLLLGRTILCNLWPDGRSVRLYGTGASRFNLRPFLEDWAILFKLLEEGQIKPIIAAKYPLLEAATANQLLESGQVTGTVVLLSPQLL